MKVVGAFVQNTATAIVFAGRHIEAATPFFSAF